jgi:hypothetical protein
MMPATGEELFLQRGWLRDIYIKLARSTFSELFFERWPSLDQFSDKSATRYKYMRPIFDLVTNKFELEYVPYKPRPRSLAEWEADRRVTEEERRVVSKLYLEWMGVNFYYKFLRKQKQYGFEDGDVATFCKKHESRLTVRETTSMRWYFDDTEPDWWTNWNHLTSVINTNLKIDCDEFRCAMADVVAGRNVTRWEKMYPTSFGQSIKVDLSTCEYANDGNHHGRCGLPYQLADRERQSPDDGSADRPAPPG